MGVGDFRPEVVLTWGGVSSDLIDCRIEGFPSRTIPARSVTSVEVPGRNGSLHIDGGYYLDYKQQYTIYWLGYENSAAVLAWLHKEGLNRLEDSMRPDAYREAVFAGDFKVENIGNQMFRADVEFICKPQWYRTAGETAVTVSNGDTLTNTGMPTRPIITIKGTSACSGKTRIFSIGGTQVTVKFPSASATVVIDCELQECYNAAGTRNYNSYVTFEGHEFPTFQTGANVISWDEETYISSVKVTPRWWDLL